MGYTFRTVTCNEDFSDSDQKRLVRFCWIVDVFEQSLHELTRLTPVCVSCEVSQPRIVFKRHLGSEQVLLSAELRV